MAGKWKTVSPGIRVRDHPSRRHGVRLDRYFTLRFSTDGRQVEEALGWASEGWTLARAQEELGKLREAKRRLLCASVSALNALPNASRPRPRLADSGSKRRSRIYGTATARR